MLNQKQWEVLNPKLVRMKFSQKFHCSVTKHLVNITIWHDVWTMAPTYSEFMIYAETARLVLLLESLMLGPFTHETESPWPLHFKHSHWWKRWSQSKFASHYTWGTNGVCECKMDVSLHGFLCGIEWIMVHGHLNYFQIPPLGGRPNTKPLGGHGILNTHNVDLFYFIMCEDPHEQNFIEMAFGWGSGPYDFTLHYMILEVPWDGLWTLSFGLSRFHGHGSWLVCEVALNLRLLSGSTPWVPKLISTLEYVGVLTNLKMTGGKFLPKVDYCMSNQIIVNPTAMCMMIY